jgi:16S rRNA U516 pseudouridylate synthase RsuA-like enzyme
MLSKAGVGSRTEARKWIAQGRVAVDGRKTRDLTDLRAYEFENHGAQCFDHATHLTIAAFGDRDLEECVPLAIGTLQIGTFRELTPAELAPPKKKGGNPKVPAKLFAFGFQLEGQARD